MPNFVSAQQAFVLHLEDPSTTCERTRSYVNERVAQGGRYGLEWPSPLPYKLFNLCMYFTYLPYGTSDNVPNDLGGSITLELNFEYGGTQYSLKVTRSATGFIGIGANDIVQFCKNNGLEPPSDVSFLSFYLTNNSETDIVLKYVMGGCFVVYCYANGLVSNSYGDRLGFNESYPDFGLCRAHGEATIKDAEMVFRKLCVQPIGGIPSGFYRYDCRTEFFLGSVLDGTFELDEVVYSTDDVHITFRLKSPFLRLDNYISAGSKIIQEGVELTTFIAQFVNFAKNNVGIPTDMYDFGAISEYVPWDDYIIGFGTVGEGITFSKFLDYICQLTCSNIALRNNMSVSMRYGFDITTWFPFSTALHEGLSQGPKYNQSNILSTVQYNPIRGNLVDKVTYSPYVISIDEAETVEETTVFPITNLRDYSNLADDLQGYNSYWQQRSPVNSDYLGAPYGTLCPRPHTGDQSTGDLEYVSGRGWGVYARKLENMMKRSLTRGFLWRFPIVTDYSGINTKTKVTQAYLNDLATAHQQAAYMADRPSQYSESRLLEAGGADFVGAPTVFDVTFRAKPTTSDPETYHTLQVRPVGRVKRTSYTRLELINPSQTHELYANLAEAKYMSTASVIRTDVYVSYWYTTIFGGVYANEMAEEAQRHSGSGRVALLRSSMRKVSPSSKIGGPDNRLYVKGWAESKATKMSEYIRLEETSEQAYVYTHPWDQTELKPCEFMLWTSFGDDSLQPVPNSGFSFRNKPALDWKNPSQDAYLYRVGLWKGADGSQAYTLNDVTSKSGHGFNSTVSYMQRGWGYRVFWEEGSTPNGLWWHTGDDSNAHGGYLKIKSQSYNYTQVEYDGNGKAVIRVTMPSSDAAKATIMASNDNFLGDSTQFSEDHPGRGRVQEANAWLTFWNPAYSYSVFTRTSSPQYESTPIGEAELENLDESAGSKVVWLSGRPLYGYVLKDIKVVTTITNCYSVIRTESKTVQFGRQNKYNYTFETNPLMYNSTYLGQDVLQWGVENVANSFSNGKHVLRFKSKAVFYQRVMDQTTVVRRPPRLGDHVNGSEFTIIKDGVATPVIAGVDGYFVRGIEVVNQDGQLYYNVELMEA